MIKLCGNKEPCFKTGVSWGYLKDVMCEHLIDLGTEPFCENTNEVVAKYTTQKSYNELLEIKLKNSQNPIEKLMHEIGYPIENE